MVSKCETSAERCSIRDTSWLTIEGSVPSRDSIRLPRVGGGAAVSGTEAVKNWFSMVYLKKMAKFIQEGMASKQKKEFGLGATSTVPSK